MNQMIAPDSHIAIIGGGIVGCATAYYLTRLGHSNITLYEQAHIASHSSGKAGGFLARGWCDGTDLQDLARASYDLHMELRGLYPELGYRDVDTFQVNTSHEEQRPRDLPVKWLSGTHVTSVKLLDTTKNTCKVNPRELCQKLITQAKLGGVKVEYSKVTQLTRSPPDHVTHLVTSSGPVEVDVVVVAAGPWTTQFVNAHIPGEPLPPLAPQTRAHSVVVQLPGTGGECLFQYHVTPAGHTVDPEIYPAGGGQLYICGEVDHVALPATPDLITPDLGRCEALLDQASHAVGGIRSAQVLTRQACYLPGSKDGVPVVGRVPGVGNVYLGTGHTFWGILNGPATGKCLAELIVTGRVQCCDIAPYSPGRF